MHTGPNSHDDEAQCPIWVKSGRVRCERLRPLRANGGLTIRLTDLHRQKIVSLCCERLTQMMPSSFPATTCTKPLVVPVPLGHTYSSWRTTIKVSSLR